MEMSVIVKPSDGEILAPRDCRRGVSAQEIVVADGTRIISARAFEGFSTLRRIILPKSLESIWNRAFKGCTALERVDFPPGLRTIDEEAFAGCAGLKSVAFPDETQLFGRSSFRGCVNLKEIKFPAVLWDVCALAFDQTGLFKGFTDAVDEGRPSEEALAEFRKVVGCDSNWQTRRRALAFSWDKESISRFKVGQFFDWPDKDFDDVIGLLADIPFLELSPRSPIGRVEKLLLDLIRDGRVPSKRKGRVLREIGLGERWHSWIDPRHDWDPLYPPEVDFDWSLLPDELCGHEKYRSNYVQKQQTACDDVLWGLGYCGKPQHLCGNAKRICQYVKAGDWAQVRKLVDACDNRMPVEAIGHWLWDRDEDAVLEVLSRTKEWGVSMPLRQMLFYVCANWGNLTVVAKIVDAIENSSTGVVKSVFDVFGNNLLWYSLYQSDGCKGPNVLSDELIKCGCDPSHKNRNNISWLDMVGV